MKYADIIVDSSLGKLDKTFQYALPASLEGEVRPGVCVRVPFGGAKKTGYVVGLSEEPSLDPARIRPVEGIVKGADRTAARMIALAAWMRDFYGCTMNAALRTVMPVRRQGAGKVKKELRRRAAAEEIQKELDTLQARARHSAGKEALLRTLLSEETVPWDRAVKGLGADSSAIRDLEKKGLFVVREKRVFRDPVSVLSGGSWPAVGLNRWQQEAADRFASDWDAGLRKTYLLFGVTGSGKTEVYMEMIERVLADGRQVIVLIPEIALTPQTVTRFHSRFPDRISLVHSRMTDAERADQFDRARAGEISVMIGPRSALFTPFANLGLVILDEEHETSYKSEITPRYHARETAEELIRLADASLVLGSATPSLETYFRAQNDEIALLTLPERAAARPLPETEVIDLREELRSGNRSILSRRLQEEMEAALDSGQQIMLFLNRRGVAGFVNCRACGHVIKCPHCEVSLTLHRDGRLKCHYCGFSAQMADACPACGSPYIGTMRAGTQRVQEVVEKRFPNARVLRMDLDTTRGKKGHQAILDAFTSGKADVLIGTQMIVKGHDFPGVTLVGVLAADMSLFGSDFRSAERTFDLLVQASGRAGRGEQAGRVLIQTYQPEHFAIRAAAAADYPVFFEQELAYRSLLRYPPLWHMLSVQFLSESEEAADACAGRVADALAALGSFSPDMTDKDGAQPFSEDTLVVQGPMDAVISRVKDRYKKVIYARCASRQRLMQCRHAAEAAMLPEDWNRVTLWFDFDPVSMF